LLLILALCFLVSDLVSYLVGAQKLAPSLVYRRMPPKPDAQFFKNLSHQWMNAWKERDQVQLELLVADDFYFISKTIRGLSLGKQDWLHMVLDVYALDDYLLVFINIVIYEHTAVVIYQALLSSRPNYNGEPEKYLVTDVWTYHEQRWQAVSRLPIPL
jgi:Domain of unknown function (DUF4440)